MFMNPRHENMIEFTMSKNEADFYPYSVTDLSSRDALIIAPHPDDESLGCGGSIAKHIKAGSRVKVIFLTDGDKGDFQSRFGGNYTKIRRKSADKAMEMLGVNDYEFWSYGDRELYLREDEIERRLPAVIGSFSPALIYAPSPFEAHPDHRASFNAVWRTTKQMEITLVLYEVLMALYPNTLVDITNEMEQKKRAVGCYFTELSCNDYVAKIEGLNSFRTATLPDTVKHAEGFISVGRGSSVPLLPASLLAYIDLVAKG
jgi:LmbE family N-acetylglucosaminyl deacetylase